MIYKGCKTVLFVEGALCKSSLGEVGFHQRSVVSQLIFTIKMDLLNEDVKVGSL